MLDFHALKREAKTSLLRRWQQIDASVDPLIWSWITHVFSVEGTKNNPLLAQALEQARLWMDSEELWDSDVQLASIGLLCSAFIRSGEEAVCTQILPKLILRVQQLQQKGVGKFSRLNDPFFVFGIVLGLKGHLSDDLRDWLRQHCERNAQPGNLRRQLLFAAAAHELNGNIAPLAINGSDLQVHDIFPALWFAERYPQLIEGEERRRGMWEAFDLLKEGISLEDTPGDTGVLYTATPIDIAMFYEALLRQTQDIDQVSLFNNMPWHPEVRRAAESLFIKSEYTNAVLEAAKLFVHEVKNKAGNPIDKNGKPLDGGPLMEKVFGSKKPILKFNDLRDQTEENEQRGLALIAQGTVSALRNPKGHLPKALISLGPYEAFEQLAVISYLMRRLDSAHT